MGIRSSRSKSTLSKGIMVLFSFAVFLSACTGKGSYEQTSQGVLVHLSQQNAEMVQTIALQVVSENIIHVTASPEANLKPINSLIIVDKERAPVAFEVKEIKNGVVLSTKGIQAKVSLITGEVVFKDSLGHVILQEQKGGGKFFKSTSYDGEKGYQIRQVFESPADEAFYGLGQHQEGLMNYKGEDVSLFQYNTKVAIPFVVSNKNYGILWDNYSLSKFGNPQEYQSISKLKLYDKTGQEGGLSADYLSKSDTSKVYLSSVDTAIVYEYLTDLSKYPKEFPLQDGLVNWEGSIGGHESGEHKFFLYYAGYVKVWLDGKLVADHWRQAWNPGTVKFDLPMEAGKKYPIRIEWLPDGNESFISLKWQNAPAEEQNRLSIFSEAADQIDYYFIAGSNLDQVIAGYRDLSGKAEIYPKWAFGFWQSRERYQSQKELLDVVAEFRKRQIPLDNIVLDWLYWEEDKWGSQDFDLKRFPDADGMIKTLHEQYNTKIMISVWPKFYEGIDTYKAFDEKGWLYKESIRRGQKDWKGYVSTFYDVFNADAREGFWNLIHDKLYVKGIDAWWMDATEPDIQSNASIEDRKKFMNPTALGSSTKYFNAFPLMNEMGFYEGQRKADPNKRVFILTRSAFAGSQRYAATTWSGDIAANWQDFKTQIPAGLNFSLSGIPYWTHDIGGFSVERKFENAQGEDLEKWRELNTRWYQFGAFSPLFRAHGQFPYREVFNIAPESHQAYQSIVYYNKLRYKLLPYIYSVAAKTYFEDYTIMRALVMDFAHDKNVLNIGHEYMYGPSILVSPVTEYQARKWNVYLPEGTGWYDFHTGQFYEGGQQIEADAPYERIPLFVKAGAILPLGPEIQYTAEKNDGSLTIYVFAGQDGAFNIYEDDNLSYDYTKGVYSTIPLQYHEATGVLTIGQRQGQFTGVDGQRKISVVCVSKDLPTGVGASHSGLVLLYDGTEVKLNLK